MSNGAKVRRTMTVVNREVAAAKVVTHRNTALAVAMRQLVNASK